MAAREVAQSVPVIPPEDWEAKGLGAGMVVVGCPQRGYELRRKLKERAVKLAGATMRGAYRNAAMGLIGAKDWDALFQKHREAEPREPRRGFVYFIGGSVGRIKIGFAANPGQRLRDLQCGSPVSLTILATVAATETAEREYHRRFAGHRAHREWFERCPEIEAEIARLNAKDSTP